MPRCVVTRRLHCTAVLDLQRWKDVVPECLARHSDREHFNRDVPWFAELPPTAETSAAVGRRVLEPALKPAALKRIRLRETDRNNVDCHGT
jgi:hypothetical protein